VLVEQQAEVIPELVEVVVLLETVVVEVGQVGVYPPWLQVEVVEEMLEVNQGLVDQLAVGHEQEVVEEQVDQVEVQAAVAAGSWRGQDLL
jgi:hypothetical protein